MYERLRPLLVLIRKYAIKNVGRTAIGVLIANPPPHPLWLPYLGTMVNPALLGAYI